LVTAGRLRVALLVADGRCIDGPSYFVQFHGRLEQLRQFLLQEFLARLPNHAAEAQVVNQ
jgi:hypothetical protein